MGVPDIDAVIIQSLVNAFVYRCMYHMITSTARRTSASGAAVLLPSRSNDSWNQCQAPGASSTSDDECPLCGIGCCDYTLVLQENIIYEAGGLIGWTTNVVSPWLALGQDIPNIETHKRCRRATTTYRTNEAHVFSQSIDSVSCRVGADRVCAASTDRLQRGGPKGVGGSA